MPSFIHPTPSHAPWTFLPALRYLLPSLCQASSLQSGVQLKRLLLTENFPHLSLIVLFYFLGSIKYYLIFSCLFPSLFIVYLCIKKICPTRTGALSAMFTNFTPVSRMYRDHSRCLNFGGMLKKTNTYINNEMQSATKEIGNYHGE